MRIKRRGFLKALACAAVIGAARAVGPRPDRIVIATRRDPLPITWTQTEMQMARDFQLRREKALMFGRACPRIDS